MGLFRSKLLAALSLLSLMIASEAPAETISRAASLGVKIDLADRQRMLIQKIARSHCFILGNIEVVRHKKMATEAIELFSDTQKHLRHGSDERNIAPESDPAVLRQLDAVDEMWRTYRAASLQMVHDDHQSVVMMQILNMTNELMFKAGATVSTLVALSDGETLSPDAARSVDVAGRQRMLSQEATRLFCLLALQIGRTEDRLALLQSVETIEDSLRGLAEGKDGLLPPPTIVVEAQLKKTRKTWGRLKAILQKATQQTSITPTDLIEAGTQSDRFLIQVNAVVHAYATQ